MPPALTFTLIVTAELLLLFRLAIPYAWESFIAFGQTRFDAFYVEATPWGDVLCLPEEAKAGTKTRGRGGERQVRRQPSDTRHNEVLNRTFGPAAK